MSIVAVVLRIEAMANRPHAVADEYTPPADLRVLDVDNLHRLYAASPTPELETELLRRYQGRARPLASRFARRGESAADLRQVALLALVRALRRFDLSRGTQFTTYAVPGILGELRRHFREHGWLVRPPRPIQEAYLRVSGARDDLERDLRRTPSVGEVADYTALAEAAVLESFSAAHGRTGVSLETPLSSHDALTLEDALGEDDVDMLAAENSMFLRQLLTRLPEEQRQVVLLSFFTDLSQARIASRLGTSQMNVSRLRGRALDLLRASARAGTAAV
jgi:RNA polymerase sigma-B factor